MNRKLFLICLFAAASVMAGDPLTQFNSIAIPPIANKSTAELDKWFSEKRSAPVIVLGKSDFVLSGPIVEQFRTQREPEHLNLGQKFLRLPVVRLFVPKPMESPIETGRYFAWRSESTRPWAAVAGNARGNGPTSNFINHEPTVSLISLGK